MPDAVIPFDSPGWRGFVRRMRDEPAEDAHRLVACDWLEERVGESPFPTLIRRMLAIDAAHPGWALGTRGWYRAGGTVPADWAPWNPAFRAHREARSLFAATWGHWFGGLIDEGRFADWRFRRGFPERVVCDWEEWSQWGDQLCGMGPVGDLVLLDGPELIAVNRPRARHVAVILGDRRFAGRVEHDEYLLHERELAASAMPRGPQITLLGRVIAQHFCRQIWPAPAVRSILVNPYWTADQAIAPPPPSP